MGVQIVSKMHNILAWNRFMICLLTGWKANQWQLEGGLRGFLAASYTFSQEISLLNFVDSCSDNFLKNLFN